jgi:Cu(I)/Ag(I) efflux system membrane fusion protein
MKGKIATILVGVFIGIILMILLNTLVNKKPNQAGVEKTGKDKPIYWVAPMDPNYKRDQPGKSPMGMDLIPVYDKGNNENETGPGAIKISPNVVNNLGVKIATAKSAALHTEINTVGYIQFDEDQLVHINPRVEGWIEKLYVKSTGDPVKNGQALYEIYSPSLVNAQEELLLALKRNNQTLINASKERLRSLQLPQSAINSILQNKKIKQNITFYAPQSGVVDNLMIRQGMFVKPGNTIMSIGKLDQVWVEAEVFERQASIVKVGSPVSMTTDFLPGKTWRGKVDYIYPTLDPQTRTLKVRLIFENINNLLKPNMFSQVSIHSNNSEKLLLVPRQSVIRTGSFDRVVLALGNGKFKSIEVEVGLFDKDYVEIIAGLNPGDEVVTSAHFLLDSESSKSSDFIRMNHENALDKGPSSLWVKATINSVMEEHRMINVDHESISQWGWPAMTMDFIVTDSVNLQKVRQGSPLNIQITKINSDSYEVSDIQDSISVNNSDLMIENSAIVTGVINSLMKDHGMLNITRGPIKKWNRPEATLDFISNNSVDLSNLEVGMNIEFTFHIEDGRFVITNIKPTTEVSK